MLRVGTSGAYVCVCASVCVCVCASVCVRVNSRAKKVTARLGSIAIRLKVGSDAIKRLRIVNCSTQHTYTDTEAIYECAHGARAHGARVHTIHMGI